LNGGWEALEQHRIDLLVAAPGPVPKHKGYRSAALGVDDLLAVIAAKHPMAKYLKDPERFEQLLPQIRRVVSHDTSQDGIARSAGFTTEAYPLFVQNMDQKVLAVEAGIGVSHLPRSRITEQLAAGSLLALPTQKKTRNTRFLAWHLSNKGKALKALSDKLISRAGNQKL
jgi:DNA-binding transcriptional LysR family regulator